MQLCKINKIPICTKIKLYFEVKSLQHKLYYNEIRRMFIELYSTFIHTIKMLILSMSFK